jgi:hypothetical protein
MVTLKDTLKVFQFESSSEEKEKSGGAVEVSDATIRSWLSQASMEKLQLTLNTKTFFCFAFSFLAGISTLGGLGKALNNEAFSDVTFIVEEKPLLAHRCVLAARSIYFRTMFTVSCFLLSFFLFLSFLLICV